MSNVIVHKGPVYDNKNFEPESSRPIKTTVSLFGSKKDVFSHKAPTRHAKIDGRPSDYEDMAGGHKEEKE